MRRHRVLGIVLGLSWVVPAAGQVIVISPAISGSNEQFENVANTLQPGDELVLRGGTYSQTGRRAIRVNGTASAPIIIRAAAGERPLLTRPAGDYTQNNIEIENSSYLIVRGLRFEGGSSGVRFIGGQHITFEDNEVFNTGNNAITLNSGNTDSFIIRRNHIHHTGLDTGGATEGEGMYLGCNNDTCRVTNSLIEGNYIHHLRSTSDGGNDGIELKVGSYGNIIRDNVIHDTTIGRRYPCIFVYGGGPERNIVEGNALWNCGEAIQVVADAVVRNNLILDSDTGITAAPHSQVGQVRNVSIVHNTIVNHRSNCLYIRWSGASNMVLANNAVYCPASVAVDAAGLVGGGIVVSANVAGGSLRGVSIDNSRWWAGGSLASALRDAATKDVWPLPGSPLLGRADAAHVAARDFNNILRAAPYDIGAYETEGLDTNPGWRPVEGFKGSLTRPLPRPPSMLRTQ